MITSKRALRGSILCLLGFATFAGAVGLGTVLAPVVAPVLAQQQMPSTKNTTLMNRTLSDVAGREVTMLTLDIPPGGGSPMHRHPSAHIFGYVLEGAYKTKLDNGAETVLTKGQTFYEAPGQLHAVSRNASDTEPAKVLVVAVAEAGKPLTVPEKP
jgi:quercetin dioxygenase-like cupin family protein